MPDPPSSSFSCLVAVVAPHSSLIDVLLANRISGLVELVLFAPKSPGTGRREGDELKPDSSSSIWIFTPTGPKHTSSPPPFSTSPSSSSSSSSSSSLSSCTSPTVPSSSPKTLSFSSGVPNSTSSRSTWGDRSRYQMVNLFKMAHIH